MLWFWLACVPRDGLGGFDSGATSASCFRWQEHMQTCEQDWTDELAQECEGFLAHLGESCGPDALDRYETARIALFDCLDVAGSCHGADGGPEAEACYEAFRSATEEFATCLTPADTGGIDSGDPGDVACQTPRSIAYGAPTSPTTDLSLEDDGVAVIELGFTATVLDIQTDTVHVAANGVVSLGEAQDGCCFGEDVRERQALVAVAWTDLDPTSGGRVAYDLTEDKLVVSWEAVPQCCDEGLEPVTASLVLGPDALEVHTTSLKTETPATQGVAGLEQAVCDEARQAAALEIAEDAWAWP